MEEAYPDPVFRAAMRKAGVKPSRADCRLFFEVRTPDDLGLDCLLTLERWWSDVGSVIASEPVRISAGQRTTILGLTVSGGELDGVLGTTVIGLGANPHFLGSMRVSLKDVRTIPVHSSSLSLTSDGERGAESTQELSMAAPQAGLVQPELPSARIVYRFRKGWRFIQIEPTTLKTVELIGEAGEQRAPLGFGLWLYGDSKGCQARLRFIDSTGQTFQPDGPKIDYTGWRYVNYSMESPPDHTLSHWGGANDGVIHYPIRWDSIFLLDNVSRQPVEGEIYLSAPTLIY
jgi:hypothetical protein